MRFISAKLVALCCALAWFTGCSFDQIAVLDHPDKVNQAQQFDVTLYNQFEHVTNSGTISSDIIRDSVHFAVNSLPGWTIVSAKSYVARNFNIVALASRLNDTVALYKAFYDSSVIFKSRATAMALDANFATTLAGRSYSINDRHDANPLTLQTNSVTWKCYRSPAGITIAGGTRVDTIMVNDSTGDTTGVSAVPVFIWVTLQAPAANRVDTLYYFSKTDPMPAPTDTSSIDIGDIVYVPITVGTASVLSGRNFLGRDRILVRSSGRAGSVEISLGNMQRQTTGMAVYSLAGGLVADLSPMLRCSSGEISWQPQNSGVKAGMYILRCKTDEGFVSQQFKVVR